MQMQRTERGLETRNAQDPARREQFAERLLAENASGSEVCPDGDDPYSLSSPSDEAPTGLSKFVREIGSGGDFIGGDPNLPKPILRPPISISTTYCRLDDVDNKYKHSIRRHARRYNNNIFECMVSLDNRKYFT